MDRLMLPAKRLAAAAGVDGQARWLWSHRPGTGKDRHFAQWLAERDEADNHRIRLILASVLSEDSNCIDIGASEGHMLGDMVRLAPSGSHLAYEPLPEPAARLAAAYPNVDVRRKAVTNESGEVRFVHVLNGSGWSGLREYEFGIAAEVEHVMVEAVRLDADLPEGYCPSFIKVDVNGAEIELFEGAIQTLSRTRPYVLFEHGIGCRAFGHIPGDVYPVLVEKCGLRLFDLDGNGPMTMLDFRLSTTRGSGTFWLGLRVRAALAARDLLDLFRQFTHIRAELVELACDFLHGNRQRRRFRHLLSDDVVAQVDALIADEDTSARNHLLHLLLILPTEGTLRLGPGLVLKLVHQPSRQNLSVAPADRFSPSPDRSISYCRRPPTPEWSRRRNRQ